MVLNKKGTLQLCPNFMDLNKSVVKDKFPIQVINDLFDELHGAKIVIKQYLCFGYL